MDYGRLNRKELQALCKEHGIPANKTNVYMAEALSALLKAPKETEQSLESIPDPAEVVKSRAKRGTSSKKGAAVLEEIEVEDLSSQLAKSTIAADNSDAREVEPADEDTPELVGEPMIEVPSEIPQEIEVVSETAKVPRRPRKQTSKVNTKALSSIVDAAPALAEPTLEVVLQVDAAADSFYSATPDLAPESGFQSTYLRRQKVVEPELTSAIPENVHAEDSTVTLAPVEEIVVEETIVAPKAVTKKSKAKGKAAKKVKPVSSISLPVLEDAVVPGAAQSIPDSPTLGLAHDAAATDEVPLRAVSVSPGPVEEFEFQPVPASFVEIMTPGKPLVEVTNGGRVRNGRKFGKSLKSVMSEAKVANIMQDTLQQIDIAKVNSEPEVVSDIGNNAMTPVKQSDDKENSLKNMDLNTLSLRKLQRAARGLHRAVNDTRAKA